ncbi:MAG TPA: hypothetical protein VH351_02455 [Bryobacteraceae bacterium]|jgi:DNA-binding NarL/FixJ family response regulator|nr:hypothetical protein [Bryobacteraceae bacterium]
MEFAEKCNCNFLHIESSSAAAFFFRSALLDAKVRASVFHVPDASLGLKFLEKLDHFLKVPTPDLVVLGSNNNGISRFEMLRRARGKGLHGANRFVVISSSDHAGDLEEAMQLGALACYEAPRSYDGLLTIASEIGLLLQRNSQQQPSVSGHARAIPRDV